MLADAKIAMGDKEWTIAPLTIGQLRRLEPYLAKCTSHCSMFDDEVVTAIVEVVAASLHRNYPGLTEEDVADMLDFGNAANIANAVLLGSGLKPGEHRAAARAGGITSTASLPPHSAIASATSMN